MPLEESLHSRRRANFFPQLEPRRLKETDQLIPDEVVATLDDAAIIIEYTVGAALHHSMQIPAHFTLGVSRSDERSAPYTLPLGKFDYPSVMFGSWIQPHRGIPLRRRIAVHVEAVVHLGLYDLRVLADLVESAVKAEPDILGKKINITLEFGVSDKYTLELFNERLSGPCLLEEAGVGRYGKRL